MRPKIQILAQLIKEIVTENYKALAKDELISKFVSAKIDPALLVELSLSSEMEALRLADLKLKKLMTTSELNLELQSAVEKLQSVLSRIYPENVLKLDEKLMKARAEWMGSRMHFYSRWLSFQDEVASTYDLARLSFRSHKTFLEKLEDVFRADDVWATALLKQTSTTFKLLVQKQTQTELSRSKEMWKEFARQSFKEAKALP